MSWDTQRNASPCYVCINSKHVIGVFLSWATVPKYFTVIPQHVKVTMVLPIMIQLTYIPQRARMDWCDDLFVSEVFKCCEGTPIEGWLGSHSIHLYPHSIFHQPRYSKVHFRSSEKTAPAHHGNNPRNRSPAALAAKQPHRVERTAAWKVECSP